MIAPSRAWPLVLALACVGWSNARAQELTLTRDSEASFRCLMRMTQEGKLGAQIQNANIALMGAQARIELVQHDGPAKVLSLARRRSAGGVSRYFDVEPGEHATPADVALVGRALDECFAEDPFQFAGLEESLAGGPPPGIGAAWRLDGWRGLVRAIERRTMALASLEYTIAISIALLVGFVTSVLVVWMTKPSPQHDPEGRDEWNRSLH